MPDFFASRLSPLEIPEIIAMVGQRIPLCCKAVHTDLFDATKTTFTTVFAPKDLLACTAVSRTWRRILLPILWRSYDGALMRYVPLTVLQVNSVFFRSFRDQYGHHHSGPFFATNLRHLVISQQHSWTVPFMHANPALQHLTWTGFGRSLRDNEYTALTSLANLHDLCLSNWNLSGRQLALILCASPHLLRLSLSSVDGIQDLNGMLILCALEEISLGFVSQNSQCLLELVRYCPNLKRISFLGTWIPEQARNLLELSTRIRSCCPHLSSIHFSAAYCFGTDNFNTLQDFEYAALAQSAQSLEHFAAESSCLGPMLTTSLISHMESLVAIDLCIRRRIRHLHPHDGGGGGTGGSGEGLSADGQTDDIVNTARILSTCSHLRVFRLSSAENVIDMEAALQLFATPWACLGLEVLSLGQISLRSRTKQQQQQQKQDGSSQRSPSLPTCSFGEYGWYVQSKSNTAFASAVASKAAPTTTEITKYGTVTPATTPPASDTEDDQWTFASEFRRKLLPQVNLLTVLRELYLNKVHYGRAAII
ncbi:hypothetical protein EDD11_000743 [Mortierella claussenii]|nr:hypothetical protein EDD11_000743 [Mortierella claussenii]